MFVLIASFGFSIHTELLSNFSQTRIQAEQTKKLTKTMKKENEDHRIMLDLWFNHNSLQKAKVISYAVTRDESMQSREALKEIAQEFDVPEIAIFSQDGKMKATNADFDHIDLYKNPDLRMSKTFIPLLDGLEENASTPITVLSMNDEGKQEKTKSGLPANNPT